MKEKLFKPVYWIMIILLSIDLSTSNSLCCDKNSMTAVYGLLPLAQSRSGHDAFSRNSIIVSKTTK